jgi:hypothetical protein
MTDKDDAALARDYRKAAAGDAYHERAGGDPASGGDDPTLVPTPERPDQPMTDVALPDVPIDARGIAPQEGADSPDDALKRGLEPGEMGETGGQPAAAKAPAESTERTLHLFGDRMAADPQQEQSR